MALDNCNYTSWKYGTLNKFFCAVLVQPVYSSLPLRAVPCNFCRGTSQAAVGVSVLLAGSSWSASRRLELDWVLP